MSRISKIIIFLVLATFPFTSNSHIQHYEKLKRIEFDIYRNNNHIGKHIFSFKKKDNQLEVESEINFKIKKFGVVLYKYYVKGTEFYKDGELIKFNSKTNQNGKDKYVDLILKNDKFQYYELEILLINFKLMDLLIKEKHQPIMYWELGGITA